MNAKLLLIFLLPILVPGVQAQTPATPTNAPPTAPVPIHPDSSAPAGATFTAPPRLTPKLTAPSQPGVGGSVAAVVNSKAPLQMVNPLAPAEYGDGTQYLSRDLLTGRPQGVNLFSFSFGGGDTAKKPKKPRTPKTSKPSAKPAKKAPAGAL